MNLNILNKLNNNYEYPLLILDDSNNKLEMFIATSKNNIKSILVFDDYNTVSLIRRIEEQININSIIDKSNKGDENIIPLDIIVFNEKYNWDKLLDNISNINKYINDNKLSNTINNELKNNYNEDLSSSIINTIYSSLILLIISKSQELSINNLMFIGKYIYENKFISLIDKHLGSEYNVYMLDL